MQKHKIPFAKSQTNIQDDHNFQIRKEVSQIFVQHNQCPGLGCSGDAESKERQVSMSTYLKQK